MSEAFTSRDFNHYLAEHRLMGSRCTACGALYVPPRRLCPACFEAAMEWVEMGGQGMLLAYTTVHIAPTAMIAAGYGRDNPYCAGIVRLDEGPSISAQIVGVDAQRPGTIAIGTPLHVSFVERGQDKERRTYLAFEPAASGPDGE